VYYKLHILKQFQLPVLQGFILKLLYLNKLSFKNIENYLTTEKSDFLQKILPILFFLLYLQAKICK